MTRVLRGVGAALAAVLASSLAPAGSAAASVETWCADELTGTWDGRTCAVSVPSVRRATMTIAASIPADLQENPVAGPLMRDYLADLVADWRGEGALMVRDSTRTVDHVVYSHGSATSVVFHEFAQTEGSPPNNAYRTFTFDLGRGVRLELADLFQPGVDPLTALPPLIEPYLLARLDAAPPPHDPGTYPFTVPEWTPQPDGSGYSGDYRAFAVTPDELILYLPDAPMAHENPFPRDRFVWSMDGGTVIVHVPLADLASILRPL